MDKKKLFLVDGYSLLYRAYYAIRRLSTSRGFPTNAIYGFLSMLRKLQDKEGLDYLGVVFDVKGPTIRHEAYKDYKAHRKPMPEDMSVQIPVLKKILKAMHIPFFEYEKYEADDVLGSLAKKASSKKIHSVIVSTDKDLFQIVDESTTMYNPVKEIYLDEKRVKEEFGVPPGEVVAVLALWGDPSDNVPGVPGVGEKTSKDLIRQFHSIENMLKNLDQISKTPLQEKIKANIDQLELSRQLVTIEKDLEIDFNMDDFSVSEPDYEKLVPLLQELEFSSLLSEYLKKQEHPLKKYNIIYEEEQLRDLVSLIKKEKHVSLDTETDSPFPTRARLVGMSFSTKPDQAFYLPLCHDYTGAPHQISKEKAFQILDPVLTDPKIRKIGQNIKYDYIVLQKEGLTLEGIDLDTMVLSYLLEPNWGKHNLTKLALNYLQVKTIPYEEVVGKGKNELTMNAVDIDRVAPYACQDADLALKLAEKLWPKVKEKKLDLLYRKIEHPLINVLADMETWGVKIDPERLKDLSEELQESLDRYEGKIFDISGEQFNIHSPSQLAYILFEKLGLPASRRTKKTKGYSTSVMALQDLAANHPVARYALDYRQLAKLKSTYADALPLLIHPKTGRIHTSYNQTVAATGRLSSSDPNLQNIPARGEWGQRFRKAFIPENEHLFLTADYSQIELRVLAHLSDDPGLIETFLEDQDIHQETAHKVFGDSTALFPEEQRRRAKIINFSIVYGATAFSLARELGSSNSEAQQFIDLYYERYPKVKEFLEKSVMDACEKGFAETLFGRKRPVPELRHKDRTVQQFGRRIALNTPIQGTAADLMKKAMIDIWKEIKTRGFKTKMILQVHDELVFEVPKQEVKKMEALVNKRMEGVFPLKVPLKIHLGLGINWADAK
ncbi:MAG: DNA polymerase I [Candidatus Aminicenantes bacterium]|nr:DNA polymerase I [Candidatus Aminicenantes bacterium]MDH5383424.1 DNA polymerase I [Candidatus Aminicenantes bacterium]MDH5742000.1 DNA polymerase I [Candidatus Aminicenantes bacterium]